MKLAKLKIENIASVEMAEIDFDSGVLADASVFLITGDTGAGKTTILDSICLALYNTTPRLNMASGVKSNFGTDNITARNTSNLLRHGARQASAVLTFLGSDGVMYEAVWQVKRNRNNKLTSPEQTLSWGDTTVKNADAVRKVTEEAVGLDFDQFCRTTMLAQGQFTQFLKSKDDEKSEILEKLTGTEIYSEIGKKIEEIKKEKEADYNAQRSLTEGIVLLKQEEIDSLNGQKSEALLRKKQLDGEASRLDSCVKWMEIHKKLQEEKVVAERKFKLCMEVINSDSFKEEARLISDYDRMGNAGSRLQTKREAEQKVRELELEAGRLKILFVELHKGRNGLRAWIQQKNNLLEALNVRIAGAAANVPMFSNVQKIETLLNSVLETSVRVRGNTEALKKRNNSMPVIEKACSDKEDSVSKLGNLVELKEKEISAATQVVADMKPETVNEEVRRLSAEKDSLNRLNTQIGVLKDCSKTLARLEKETSALQEECKLREAEQVKLDVRLEEKNKKLVEARKAYDGVELSLRDWTVSLRSKLAVGDVCPVCGQVIDRLTTDEECEERLKPLEEMVALAEKELRETLAECNAIQIIVERLKKDIQAKLNEKKEAEDAIRNAGALVRNMCAELSVKCGEGDELDVTNLDETLHIVSANNSARMSALIEMQKKINDSNNHLTLLNNELKDIRKEFENAVKSRDKAKEDRQTVVNEIERISSLIKIDNEMIAKALQDAGGMIVIEGWRNMWDSDPSGLLSSIRNSAAEYDGWVKDVAATEKLLSQALPALENVEKILTEISEVWKDWNCDNVTDAILVDRLTDKCIDFSAKVHALTTSLANERERMAKATGELDAFLSLNQDFDLGRIEYISSIKNISEIRKQHDAEITGSKNAESVLAAKQKELDLHLASCPEDVRDGVAIEMMKSMLADVRSAIDTVMSDIGRIEQQLKSNEQNIARFSVEKEKEEAKRHIFVEWESLNKLFGGGDGKIFRRIAQSFILNDLLHRANGYLVKLNKRYRLDCEPGTLTIRMMDMYQNDAQGPVDILSGGEGFLVSLSLALALSSLNRRNLSVDTLFIDEGFGTLSGDVLNTVMNMLEKLQGINGKRVGIISHVEGLKERIPVQIKVSRIDQTRSMVEVVDNRI